MINLQKVKFYFNLYTKNIILPVFSLFNFLSIYHTEFRDRYCNLEEIKLLISLTLCLLLIQKYNPLLYIVTNINYHFQKIIQS